MIRADAQRQATHLVCSQCGRDLPVSHFQRLPRGTYRHACPQGSYALHVRPSRIRRILREQEQRKTAIKK